jgi:hypothetical protein
MRYTAAVNVSLQRRPAGEGIHCSRTYRVCGVYLPPISPDCTRQNQGCPEIVKPGLRRQ